MSRPESSRTVPEEYSFTVDKNLFPGKAGGSISLALNAVRQAGALTCGDVFAFGMRRIREGIAPGRRQFGPGGEKVLRLAVAQVIEREIPEDQAQPDEWPDLYPQLADASAGVLLPVNTPDYSFQHYSELDLGIGPVTVGTLADEKFESLLIRRAKEMVVSASPVRFGQPDPVRQLSRFVDGMLAFREEVVLPAAEQFNAQVAALDNPDPA